MENKERKLATIRKINKILPIENADAIELAFVDGWQCVVKKGEFNVGDLGVYFEIDSFLPCIEPFLFLEKNGRKKLEDGSEGYRLRTIKLRKVLSQGLLLHITAFPKLSEVFKDSVGEDVTEILGIKKWEAPIPIALQGQIKRYFPSFIKKTDQERIQNHPEYFDLYKDVEFEITEKLDGTSATYYLKDGEFGICSRNVEFKLNEENFENLYVKIARDKYIEDILKKNNKNIALQGEIAGPGIQGNPLHLEKIDFFLFDIWDIDQQRYFTVPERWNFIYDAEIINHVPCLKKVNTIFTEIQTMDELLSYAKGNSILATSLKREGLVFKSTTLIGNDVLSFKVINNDYLLGEK